MRDVYTAAFAPTGRRIVTAGDDSAQVTNAGHVFRSMI
jgi:hypothetical protein